MMGGRSTRKKVVGEKDSILKDKDENVVNCSSKSHILQTAQLKK
jgi:hypothetical protein